MKKLIKRVNRAVSCFLAATMAMMLFAAIPAIAQTGITTYNYDDFSIEYNVQNEWTGFQNVDVKITNTGTEPINSWALGYDAGGEIMGVYNGIIHSNDGTEYVIKNAAHNAGIAPNASVNFGYTLKSDNPVPPEKFENLAKRVDIDGGYEVKLVIASMFDTSFNGAIKITNTSGEPLESWELSFDSNFTVSNLWNGQIIKSENGTYTVISQMPGNPIQSGASIEIGLSGSFGRGTIPEISNVNMSVILIGEKEIDYALDSDEDGIPDYFEDIFGTDPLKSDTDEDGLTDSYELFTLNTDPLNKDTDDNGISDADEDFDNDGLNNFQECQSLTNPNNSDTDGDVLTDYDEINTYNTNPLKYDTDDDTVWDNDEFELGLDPNNPKTFGTPDAEYTVTQHLSAEDLSEVNNLNDNFTVEIDIKASNNVKRHIEQGESGYSYVLSDNRAIVGVPIVLDYAAGAIESGEIRFTLDEDYVRNNTPFYPHINFGIERYGVFIFDETLNILVPLEAEYEGNTITISTDFLGNLCIIDIEAMLYDLGIEIEPESSDLGIAEPFGAAVASFALPVENSNDNVEINDVTLEELQKILPPEIETEFIAPASFSIAAASEGTGSSIIKQVDVAFVIDTTGSMGTQIGVVKSKLAELIGNLREENISLYVSFIDYKDITCNSGSYREDTIVYDFTNSVNTMLNNLNGMYISGGGDAPETVIDGLGYVNNLSFRSNAEKFAFVITDANFKNDNIHGISDIEEIAEKLNDKNIKTCVVTYNFNYLDYIALTLRTGGICIDMNGDFSQRIYDFIFENIDMSKFRTIIGTSLVSIDLDEPLSWGGLCDSDDDDLTDSREVNWDLMNRVYNSSGTFDYAMPTYSELIERSEYYFGTASAMIVYQLRVWAKFEILPIHSNPMKEDSDNDGLLDGTVKIINGKKAGPKDPKPLIASLPNGIWVSHFEQVEDGPSIPQHYDEDSSGVSLEFDQDFADSLIVFALEQRDLINENADVLRSFAFQIKQFVDEGGAAAGAYLLSFIKDEYGYAYHSQVDSWQRTFGYNDLYDDIFRIGSNMYPIQFPFTYNSEDYILWGWKGDYWNLGSGAEFGLYIYDFTSFGTDHYDVVDYEIPMTLHLYAKNGNSYENIFSWMPVINQWWVTGFVPALQNPDPNTMVTISTANFTGREDMYWGFKSSSESYNARLRKGLIFEDDSHTVWIVWEGE